MAPKRITDYEAERAAIGSTLTSMETAINSHRNGDFVLDVSGVDDLINLVTHSRTELLNINKSIHQLAPEDLVNHISEFDTLFQKCLRLQNSLSGIKLGMPVPNGGNRNNGDDFQSTSTDIRLPRLNLQEFSGDSLEWITFRDSFSAAVASKTNLSNVQKLTYLKSLVKGEAARLLHDIVITDANYDIAWRSLSDRYHNEGELLVNVMRRLFNQPTVSESTASTAIRSLIDTTKACIRSLQILNVKTEECGSFIYYILFSKIDSTTKELWLQSQNAKKIPEIDQLFKFLEGRAAALSATLSTSTRRKDRVHANFAQQQDCIMQCPTPHRLFKCPKFLELSPPQRKDNVKKNNSCFNCLQPRINNACSCPGSCRTCGRRHHTLLHNAFHLPAPTAPANDPVHSHHARSKVTVQPALLATALITLHGRYGSVTARALLDSGATASFITTAMARKAGIAIVHDSTDIIGIGAAAAGTATGATSFTFSTHFRSMSKYDISALVVKTISTHQPAREFQPDSLRHLKDVLHADPSWYKPGPIDVLLGSNIFWSLIGADRITGKDDTQPFAIESTLGWLISGPVINTHSSHVNAFVTNLELDQSLQRFWDCESMPTTTPEMTSEEAACEEHFLQNFSRDVSGKFTVAIPWRTPRQEFGASRATALRRLQGMERRLQREARRQDGGRMDFRQEYNKFMREYQDLGHMTLIPATRAIVQTAHTFYIPHHFVLKTESTTTKFRVVFDASCLSSNGNSYNTASMVGPVVQSTLFSVLCRFRLHVIAFTADVRQMYRQFLVKEEDRDSQRILWREDPSLPVQEFWLNTVTYGTAPAAYLATRCLLQLAKEEETRFPVAANIIKSDTYVDDLMSGKDSIPDAKQAINQLTDLCSTGGLELRKWASNRPEVLPEQLQGTSIVPLEMDPTIKTLGVYWNTVKDVFQFKITPPETPNGLYTKRIILSEMAKLFDPLGWLAPVTVKGKILMQDLWKANLSWDDTVPDAIQHDWVTYKNSLKSIEDISIPRLIRNISQQQYLVGFCDASLKAYSAVVYLCDVANQEIQRYHLIASKTRVAAINATTLPRLELNGAVLLSELMATIQADLQLGVVKVLALTDSTIALGWINSDPNRWKMYVRNRVIKIKQKIPTAEWGHINGDINPADCASRGLDGNELSSHSLWWTGPPQLLTSTKVDVDLSLVQNEERKPEVHICTTSYVSNFISRFSTLKRLVRFTALIIRRQQSFKAKKNIFESNVYSVAELNFALTELVKYVQCIEFAAELKILQTEGGRLPNKSSLLPLNPFLDSNGILRVGGRLRHARLPDDVKHQMLLPRHHHLTRLIIMDVHEKVFHGGPQLTLSQLNQRFWVTRGRDTVRHLLRQCVLCTRWKAVTMKTIMGDLPAARVTQTRPFLKCGVDFAGPFLLRNEGRSKINYKSYLCLFVCFSTRALHLEMVNSLSTEAFIASLKRFCARRGVPTDIYSDSGSNFVGAKRVLNELEKHIRKEAETIQRTSSAEGINWHLGVPSAPHQHGLWEAGVKSVKYHLHRVMGERALTYEEMLTLVTQIEGILNSRPLTTIPTDTDDLQPLTPAHFLIGGPILSIPEPDYQDANIGRLDRWQLIESKKQAFWRRWHKEFITRMQHRPKWMEPGREIAVDDVVLIKEDNLPPGRWKLAKVIDLHPGKDNVTRVVSLKTKSGILKRCINKLCLLPVNNEI